MKSKLWIGLLFLTGFCIFSYPILSNYLAEKNQTKVVELYHEDVASMEEEQLEEEWQRAEAYNRTLKETIIIDPFTEDLAEELDTEYQALLNVNGVMGEIRIPKIDVEIPIYHGTSPEVLQKGIGHIQNTSLPVGGMNTHAVLSGHRGLPSAKLFSDLDELEEGDEFYLDILNRELCYQVDQIKVVTPDQTEDLEIVENCDYVTLVTCTPYSVNTHRLLVRGKRIEPVEETGEMPKQSAIKESETGRKMALFFVGIIGSLGMLIWVFCWRMRKRR
ncbi:MAG: class C sortase [[Ruminococcus] gnavus]|nr:class C sortase [Mediterraneibacter gnavus]